MTTREYYEMQSRTHRSRLEGERLKYGFLFLLLSIAIAVGASQHGPWSWLLFYPAFSFGAVASTYFLGNPAVFGKRYDGRRSVLGRLLVLPYVMYGNAIWHVVRLVSREPAMNVLGDGFILSRRLLGYELPESVASVVDLTCEFTESKSTWKIESYLCYPILDGSGASRDEIRELAVAILEMPRPVLIHCAQGHGRTGLVAAAVLLVSGQAKTAADAIAIVQSARPGIELNRVQQSVVESIQ